MPTETLADLILFLAVGLPILAVVYLALRAVWVDFICWRFGHLPETHFWGRRCSRCHTPLPKE